MFKIEIIYGVQYLFDVSMLTAYYRNSNSLDSLHGYKYGEIPSYLLLNIDLSLDAY